MTTFAAPLVRDELDSVVSTLCTRLPGRTRSEVEAVVAAVYAELAAGATVTAHLIPLTLNRSRRLLSSGPRETSDLDSSEPMLIEANTGRTLPANERNAK
ncbi:three-helix bundle dimerization domain-containing protein [Mycolicibacterium tusciae]|uniref:Uncharacterized protein n=1 Tax=Mycolicibacterium tusciae TaxID=75922 RepID=A0A1X0JMP5_9MYCO|nr:hypothetical protein BST47_17690 [Mycolicibacterium tusciae]